MIYFVVLDYLKEQGVEVNDKWHLDIALSSKYFILQDIDGDGNIDLIWNSKDIQEPNFEDLKKKIPAKELEVAKNAKCQEVEKQKNILQYSNIDYNNNFYNTSIQSRANLKNAIEKSKSSDVNVSKQATEALKNWLTAENNNISQKVDISTFAEALENAILMRDNSLYRKEAELKQQIMSFTKIEDVEKFEIKF